MKKRINSISELKPGDVIWSIDRGTARPIILEYLCALPHNNNYSIFINEFKEPVRYYNEEFNSTKPHNTKEWFAYDGSGECWDEINAARIARHKELIKQCNYNPARYHQRGSSETDH